MFCIISERAALPQAPTSVTFSLSGARQLSLSWTAPMRADGTVTDPSVRSYTTQCDTSTSFNTGSLSTVASTTTSAVHSSLTEGATFFCRVAAINDAGTGTYNVSTTTVFVISIFNWMGLRLIPQIHRASHPVCSFLC